MSEFAAVSGDAVPGRVQWRDTVAEFADSKLALSALTMLVLIVGIALLAPWISPQNPYDLNVIDVSDGRLSPGTARLSKLKTLALRATIPLSGGDVAVRSTRADDTVLIRDLAVSAQMTPGDDSEQLLLRFSFANGSALQPLSELRISGLPRSASVKNGVRDKFRPRWTVAANSAEQVVVSFAKMPRADLKLRIWLIGGTQYELMTYWLGTDAQGRDMLSAIFYGLRISLAVAVTSVLIALTSGTLIGLYAAYLGGRFDAVVMRIVDLQLSFPTILVALILLAVLGKGVGNVMLALIIVQWAFYARTARGVALSESNKEYIEACRCLALSKMRIVLVHLLPNCLPPLIVVATLQVAGAISLEATLSFLGLGLPVTQPSLGLLISNGFEYLLSGNPTISVLPGVALLVTVVSINLVGDELRDILNPHLSR